MNTNNKIVAGVLIAIVLIAIGGMGAVSAYDASNPYTCTLQWIVPSDTAFSISFAGGESSVDFDTGMTGKSVTNAEPDSQNAAGSVPIITVNNDGNVDLNFSCNLTTAKPAWATLKVGKTNVTGDAAQFDTTAVVFATNVVQQTSESMYIWTTTVNATEGTTQRTLQINSAIS